MDNATANFRIKPIMTKLSITVYVGMVDTSYGEDAGARALW